jgi:uncharacterized membrane protein
MMNLPTEHRPSGAPLARWLGIAWLIVCALPMHASAADTTPAQQLQRWSVQAVAKPDAERGRIFFNARHGGEWSCASCHGAVPVRNGKHAATGKVLDPLAPAANPRAFSEQARVDKWFRRNCRDVLERECTPGEKADVMAWLISLKP